MVEYLTQERNYVLNYMKLKNTDNFGFKCSSTSVLFAEELIKYVLKKLGYTWTCAKGAQMLLRDVDSRFTTFVGDCVIKLIAVNRRHIRDCYNRFMEIGINDKDRYRREICITFTAYFQNGYDHEKFLLFASLLTGLSAFFFVNNNLDIVDASAQFLAHALNHFIFNLQFTPNVDWFEMCLAAQNLRKLIQNEKVQFHVLPFNSE